jgi:hypothetical protein
MVRSVKDRSRSGLARDFSLCLNGGMLLTEDAAKKVGNRKTLAELLGITPAAVSQWGRFVPELRVYQLEALRPDLFPRKPHRRGRRR